MFPFHKLYSRIFKSFNIYSETETITRLKNEGIQKVMIIKRSWIYGLSLIWIPLAITLIALGNIILSIYYHNIPLIKLTNIIGVGLSLALFIISVLVYLIYFRKVYHTPRIETDIDRLLAELKQGDDNFIRFFNQTIFNQLILLIIIVMDIYFYFEYQNLEGIWIVFVDCALLILQWIFLTMYRKKMIDLEMDYCIVIPGKATFISQSGILSSSQSVDGEKVKTVSSRYPSWLASFFRFGSVEVLTEGDAAHGTNSIYYVPSPVETARLMEILLLRREEDQRQQDELKAENDGELPEAPVPEASKIMTPPPVSRMPPIAIKDEVRKISPDSSIVPKDVVYDVKGVVRDIVPGK